MLDDDPLTIRIDQQLDAPTASAVVERVRLAAPGRAVILDVGPGVECELFALSLLAEVLEQRGASVHVRGLAAHDLRILEYLGVRLPRPAPEPRD